MKLINRGWLPRAHTVAAGGTGAAPPGLPTLWWAVAALVLTLLASACGPPVHVEAPDGEGVAGRENATAARAVIDRLRNSSYADEAALDLRRAEGWLDAVEQRLADGNAGPTTRLLMLAVRTQLSAVKSFYAKREAEDALARVRGPSRADGEGGELR